MRSGKMHESVPDLQRPLGGEVASTAGREFARKWFKELLEETFVEVLVSVVGGVVGVMVGVGVGTRWCAMAAMD